MEPLPLPRVAEYLLGGDGVGEGGVGGRMRLVVREQGRVDRRVDVDGVDGDVVVVVAVDVDAAELPREVAQRRGLDFPEAVLLALVVGRIWRRGQVADGVAVDMPGVPQDDVGIVVERVQELLGVDVGIGAELQRGVRRARRHIGGDRDMRVDDHELVVGLSLLKLVHEPIVALEVDGAIAGANLVGVVEDDDLDRDIGLRVEGNSRRSPCRPSPW